MALGATPVRTALHLAMSGPYTLEAREISGEPGGIKCSISRSLRLPWR